MKTRLAALLLLLACAPAPLFAEALPGEHVVCAEEVSCRMASNAELDELRGGFQVDTPAGPLRIGIGIIRAVAVNDRLVAVSQLVVPDLVAALHRQGHGATHQVRVNDTGANVSVRVSDNAVVVQNGTANFAPAPLALNAAAHTIVLQNTLDNQKLSALTIVNASVNSLSVMNALRIGEMLNRATLASGR